MTKTTENILRNYSFIKGRVGEALVEQLFHCLGMEVFRMGLESQNPRLAHLLLTGEIDKQSLKSLRLTPDFTVVRLKKGFQVEVKYRSNGTIELKDIQQYTDDDIYFIFLDHKNFYCCQNKIAKKFFAKNKTMKFGEEDCGLLMNHPDFAFTAQEKVIINSYSVFIEEFTNLNNESRVRGIIEHRCNSLRAKYVLSTLFNTLSQAA